MCLWQGEDGFEPPIHRVWSSKIAEYSLSRLFLKSIALPTWLSPYILGHGVGLEPTTQSSLVKSIAVRVKLDTVLHFCSTN